jgi:putative ABC transport system substrate-binding protein
MIMKKKSIALILAGMMAALTACGSSAAQPAQPAAQPQQEAAAEEKKEEAAPAAESDASGKTFKIGVCQLIQHDALDAATQGFVDALKEEFGDNVEIDVQNAQGESTTCATIVTGFVSNGYDLIMANATPALQAAASATSDIPILGTSVTDYGTALGMSDFSGTTGINISGTSDLAPIDQQEDMILELVPDVKKVAILYCSSEPNSKFQADMIKGYLEEDGIAFEEFTFSDSNDIQSVATQAVSGADAVYIPTDNTAASNMTLISNITAPAGIPVICGEQNMCIKGGLATLSISYYDLGTATGKQAIEILKNGADVSAMEIEYASATTKMYNAANAEAIGATVPEDYVAIEGSESE